MSIAKQNGSILVLLLASSLVFGVGCSGRTYQRVDDDEKYEANRRPEEEVTYETVGEFTLNRAAGDLETAKEAHMNGDFEKATALFSALYKNRKNKNDIRAESLFAMGQILSDLANPNRDYKQALDMFETLISEFPKSDLIDTAHRRIEKVKGFTTN